MFSSIHLLRSGSTIFLTPSVRFPPFCCCFGLNHFYQSLLYRLNSNPPPTVTLLHPATVFPSSRCYSEWRLRTVQHLPIYPTARRVVSPVGLSQPTLYMSQRALERSSMFPHFKFTFAVSLVLSHVVLLSSLLSSICSKFHQNLIGIENLRDVTWNSALDYPGEGFPLALWRK